MGNIHRFPCALPVALVLSAALLLLGACQESEVAVAAIPSVDAPPPQAQRLTTDQQDLLLKAISGCVQLVQASAPRQLRYKGEGEFWTRFDAYYDPVSGRVVDNGVARGHVPVVFAFRKCMVEHNWSIND
ncbi:hypothetical protein PMI12_03975 [Variovorax sp. CF313]|uniref:hypothetical protein n=1 Tax=Variovorax sp. CF313 TaxID=1144315 RepID=UPI000270DCC3|nr:hypothetical protein [Variovorax sp. CF313]EJL72234.1 hypothetical protein PMI12_03975 [Variovorax sp. CF313]